MKDAIFMAQDVLSLTVKNYKEENLELPSVSTFEDMLSNINHPLNGFISYILCGNSTAE